MTLIFGSEEANGIVTLDKHLEKVRAMSGKRLEEIEQELEEIQDEIEFGEDELSELRSRRHALNREREKLEKGEPG